jgi:hypothetical protein
MALLGELELVNSKCIILMLQMAQTKDTTSNSNKYTQINSNCKQFLTLMRVYSDATYGGQDNYQQ